MAGPQHQEDGVESRRGREAAAPGQADAHPVEDHRAHRGSHRRTVPGEIAAAVSPSLLSTG